MAQQNPPQGLPQLPPQALPVPSTQLQLSAIQRAAYLQARIQTGAAQGQIHQIQIQYHYPTQTNVPPVQQNTLSEVPYTQARQAEELAELAKEDPPCYLELVKLSPSSEYYTKFYRPSTLPGFQHPNSTALDSTRTPDTFHLFPNLPIEIRAKIWKYFAAQTPTIITISSWRDIGFHSPDHIGGPILTQIDPNMSDQELELAGSVEFPWTIPRRGVAFHPEVDMLSLSRHEGYQCRANNLRDSLTRCNALHKIKTIAIDATQQDLWSMIESLKHYTSLELVFIVMRTRTMREREIWFGRARRPLERFFFSEETTDFRRSSPYRPPRKEIRQWIYKALARGRKGLTPHVFFVNAREDLIMRHLNSRQR